MKRKENFNEIFQEFEEMDEETPRVKNKYTIETY